MVENEPSDEIHGDHPPGLKSIPGSLRIDNNPSISNLQKVAENFAAERPDIIEFARNEEKDVVAESTGRGKIFVIGVGVAALVTGAAVVIYRHRKSSDSPNEND